MSRNARRPPTFAGIVCGAGLSALTLAAWRGADHVLPRLGIAADQMAHAVVLEVLGVVAWLVTARTAARVVDFWVERDVSEPGTARLPRLLQDVARVLLYGLAVVIILAFVFRIEITGLVATSGLVVAVVGFALRNMIADIFSGVAINVEHPYRLGDWIEVATGPTGRVVEINWRATRLLTKDGTSVVVPNGMVAANRLVNYSAPEPHYRSNLRITMDFAVSVERAKRVLLAGVLQAPGVMTDPPPEVVAESVGENGAVYQLRYWVRDYAYDIPSRDAVLSSVLEALRLAGLEPATPTRRFARRRLKQLPDVVSVLGKEPAFDAFRPEELQELADRAHRHRLPAGGVLLHEGEGGGALFVVMEGLLVVENEARQVIERLGPGTLFGPLFGQPGAYAKVSVRARTGAVVFEIDRPCLEPVLAKRPELAERLALQMEERRRRVEQAARQRDALAAGLSAAAAKRGLFGWFRRFGRGRRV